MNARQSLRVAWEGLTANKMRSTLTMLGVIIGVAAVIALLSIGQGAQHSVWFGTRFAAVRETVAKDDDRFGRCGNG
jgi:ABC-type lipoprotein release transport system permease subunit